MKYYKDYYNNITPYVSSIYVVCPGVINETKYSRMDQVKFVKDSL